MGPPATNMGWIVMLDPDSNPRNKARELATARTVFTRGQRTYRRRGRKDHLILWGISGIGRVASGPTAIDLAFDEMVLFAPDTPQDYRSQGGPWEYCWIHFQPRSYWLEWLGWPRIGPGFHHLRLHGSDCRDEAIHHRDRLLAAAKSTHPRRDALAMNALEALLLTIDDALQRQNAEHIDQRIEQAMTWMEQHLSRAVTLNEIAANCGMSPSRLSHLFTAQTGHPPRRWHERERMRRAAQLLTASNTPVNAIAEAMGYDDPLYFSTRFKHHHGVSPRTFRQR